MGYYDQLEADEWPPVDPKPFSLCITKALDYAARARRLGPGCDSHIEVELGVKLDRALEVIGDPTLDLQPRYFLGRYIYDLAILRKGRPYPIVIVECDGKAFHSTSQQLQNDAQKDKLAQSKGIVLLRFTGSEIHRAPDDCVASILQTMRWMHPSQLTQAQCDLLDAAGIRRYPPLPTYERDD
jgi:very-short-patch-repair endonuclease